MTPNELCQAYRNELRRLYGDQVADASRVDYGRGWYYIGVARRFGDGSVGQGGVMPDCYRKAQVEEMLSNLKKR